MDLGERTDRRTLLRTVASGVAGGLTVGSTAGARLPSEEECDRRAVRECDPGGGGGGGGYDVPVVSTRDHFYIDSDCGWWGICGWSAYRRDEYGEYEYEIPRASAAIPWEEDEVVVYCHGWRVEYTHEVVEGAKEVRHQFDNPRTDFEPPFGSDADDEPFDGGFVAFGWDSKVQPGWEVFGVAFEDQEEIGYRNGKKAAEFIADLKDRGETDTTVHWVAHSMGGHVTYGLLEDLQRRGRSIDSVTLWAPAVAEESANMNNYGPVIEESCREFDVFYNSFDQALVEAYEVEKFNEALGGKGIEGPRPCNYEQHDVTRTITTEWRPYPEISAHFEYHDGKAAGERAAAMSLAEWRSNPRTGNPDCQDDGDDGGGTPSCGDATNSAVRTDELAGRGDTATFTYTVATGDPCEVTVTVIGLTDSDFDLFVTHDGSTPGPTNSDQRSRSLASAESVTVDGDALADDTDLGIAVHSAAGPGEFRLTVSERGKRPGTGGGFQDGGDSVRDPDTPGDGGREDDGGGGGGGDEERDDERRVH